MAELDRLAALARQRDGEVDPAHDAAERARFLAAVAAPRRAARWPYAVAAAALLGALVLVVVRSAGEPLALQIDGAALAEEGYVRAGDAPATLRFSDGSAFVLSAHSAGRVVEVGAHGARVALERGSVEVSVVHRPAAAWSLAAGPYVVVVTGTRFTMTWDPQAEAFSLAMRDGAVTVRGPQLDEGVSLRAGQTLDAGTGSVSIRDAALADSGPAVAPEPAPSASASAAPETTAVASAPAPAMSWSQRIAKGDYAQVLAEAEARGIDAVLASGSIDQVVALGDAARYLGKSGVARQSLLALRERFGGTPPAQTAAFLLGRMSEGAPSSAIGWYDRYLAEAPGGPYAAEALGRKLHLLSRSDRGAAQAVAKQYLASYPKGAYAALAKQILRR